MRVAVVGAGIAGNVAARELHRDHEVTVFEAGHHVGGHSHTHEVALHGRTWHVDTGFIVFNERTYPNFIRLLKHLGVILPRGWKMNHDDWQDLDCGPGEPVGMRITIHNGDDDDKKKSQRSKAKLNKTT